MVKTESPPSKVQLGKTQGKKKKRKISPEGKETGAFRPYLGRRFSSKKRRPPNQWARKNFSRKEEEHNPGGKKKQSLSPWPQS